MKYRKEAVHATNPEVLAAGRRKLVFAALAVLAVVLVAGIVFNRSRTMLP